jgi:hypothetical protein
MAPLLLPLTTEIASGQPITYVITVDLPYKYNKATKSFLSLGGIDDCICTFPDGSTNPSGDGVRTTFPTGDIIQLPAPPDGHLTRRVTLLDLISSTEAYAQAKAVLALSARLYLRGLKVAPPQYDKIVQFPINVPFEISAGATTIACSNTSTPVPSPKAFEIPLPDTKLSTKPYSADQSYYLYHQSVLHAEAEKLVALSECLYSKSIASSVTAPTQPLLFTYPNSNYP